MWLWGTHRLHVVVEHGRLLLCGGHGGLSSLSLSPGRWGETWKAGGWAEVTPRGQDETEQRVWDKNRNRTTAWGASAAQRWRPAFEWRRPRQQNTSLSLTLQLLDTAKKIYLQASSGRVIETNQIKTDAFGKVEMLEAWSPQPPTHPYIWINPSRFSSPGGRVRLELRDLLDLLRLDAGANLRHFLPARGRRQCRSESATASRTQPQQ